MERHFPFRPEEAVLLSSESLLHTLQNHFPHRGHPFCWEPDWESCHVSTSPLPGWRLSKWYKICHISRSPLLVAERNSQSKNLKVQGFVTWFPYFYTKWRLEEGSQSDPSKGETVKISSFKTMTSSQSRNWNLQFGRPTWFCASKQTLPSTWQTVFTSFKLSLMSGLQHLFQQPLIQPQISPPNQIISLLHWKILLNLFLHLTPWDQEKLKTFNVGQALWTHPEPHNFFTDSHFHLE